MLFIRSEQSCYLVICWKHLHDSGVRHPDTVAIHMPRNLRLYAYDGNRCAIRRKLPKPWDYTVELRYKLALNIRSRLDFCLGYPLATRFVNIWCFPHLYSGFPVWATFWRSRSSRKGFAPSGTFFSIVRGEHFTNVFTTAVNLSQGKSDYKTIWGRLCAAVETLTNYNWNKVEWLTFYHPP